MTALSVKIGTAGDPGAVAHGDFVYRDNDFEPIVSARDAVLTTRDGRRLLDAEAANGGAILGYRPELLREAVKNSINLPGLPSFCESTIRLDLARRLCDIIQQQTGVQGRVAFDVGGAQGIELAIKIARRNGFTGQIVCFEGGYHGRSALAAQISGSARYRAWLPASSLAVSRLPLPDCARCRFGLEPLTCNAQCARFAVSSLLEDYAGSESSGANAPCAVVEPLLNVAGMAVPDERYLLSVVRTVQAAGGIVIADEIFTGFWRTGKLFGFQHYDFVPDMIVMSKVLTNGMAPLSAVWARTPLLDPCNFPPGSHSATFVNLPLSLALAAAALNRLGDFAQMRRKAEKTECALSGLLSRLQVRHDRPGATLAVRSWTVRGACGRLMLNNPVASDVRLAARRTPDPEGAHDGLLIASTGMMPDVVNLHPPLCMSLEEWASAERMLDTALTKTAINLSKERCRSVSQQARDTTVLPHA